MKKTELSPARQKQLVPAPTHPGAFAVIPQAPPRFIPSTEICNTLQKHFRKPFSNFPTERPYPLIISIPY